MFVLVRLMPGDPFSSDKMTPEIRANMEAYYGLDKSLPEQYITYMNNLLHGDLGYSMKYVNQSVNRIIADAFPYSADLGIRALIFAVIFGVTLGVVASLNRGKKLDAVCIIIAIIGTSIPDFIMGVFAAVFLRDPMGGFCRSLNIPVWRIRFSRRSRWDSTRWRWYRG